MKFARNTVREPAVAGRFYPADPSKLRRQVEDFLHGAAPYGGGVPKAVIAPHAGYAYSGPIAGSAFAALVRARESIRRVILVGPAHFVPFLGLAGSAARAFRTPLGEVPVDQDLMASWREMEGWSIDEEPHRPEHALEVELPFLQVVLRDFVIVPVVVGRVAGEEVQRWLEQCWGGPETCVVISSDLSHYLPDEPARSMDSTTAQQIENLDEKALTSACACGVEAIRGLLPLAKRHGLRATTLDLRNSGDTAGSRDRVVGYGAFAFATAHEERRTPAGM